MTGGRPGTEKERGSEHRTRRGTGRRPEPGGYFSHTGRDGSTFADRARAQGHPSPGAENIARGQGSAASVMEARMNSPGHRANILNCSLTGLGVGVVSSDWTWTQVFGH
ncbi:CAP domain-containing protein [Streptomyces sp. NPDC057092]|uniref:CAP domain-containing protein n=1 Tax=Streptomyces sp. NPDC057092 TaxID=3346017 RepID=UPI00363F7269